MGRPMAGFYAKLPAFEAFERVVDPSVFASLPDGSVVGISDIVQSTRAIADGRYKAVNMAGAALISGMMNELGHREFAFVFGGDGASFAVEAADAGLASDVMARTARWVADDLGLDMRIALVPVSAIRKAGHDVRVGRFAASPSASYAMFSGGGLAWAEAAMKAGQFSIPIAAAGARPDLTGLSCRWEPLSSRRGVMLSLIVQRNADIETFAALVLRLLVAIDDAEAGHGHPVNADGLKYRWPPSGLEYEARASRGNHSVARQRVALAVKTLFAIILFRTGWRVGRFVPEKYLQQSVLNTDYRKFDDGLRMTIDCAPQTADRLQAMLDEADEAGIARYGMYRQAQALMTCIVPSAMTDDHLHFVDGASGGYAMAAAQLKAKLAASASH